MMAVLKRIWNIVSTALVVLVVLCAVFLLGSRLLGYRAYNVISGSMEPTYSVGDLLYVKAVDVDTIEVGDPITFVLNDELAVTTHRVVAVDKENQCFYTKGETNNVVDPPVHFKNVIGVPKFSIPLLGHVSDFVQHAPGSYITVGAGVLLVILLFLPDLLGKVKKAKAGAESREPSVKEPSDPDEPTAPDDASAE